MNQKDGFLKHRCWRQAVIESSCAICLPAGVSAGEWEPDTTVAGRYLDRNVRVLDAAKLGPLAQIPLLRVQKPRARMPGTVYRILQPPLQVLANRLAAKARLARNRTDRQTLSSPIKYHNQSTQFYHLTTHSCGLIR